MDHGARKAAMEFRRDRQLARHLHESEELDEEHDPDQSMQIEEWEEIVEEAPAAGVPEPKTPPPGYKPLPLPLRAKPEPKATRLMPTAKGMPIPPKQEAVLLREAAGRLERR